jgi:uncharacterized protein
MMPTLYDTTIVSFLQALGAVDGFLAKGQEHAAAQGIDLNSLVESRLHEDMYPLRFQVIQTVAHSIGAIEGVRKGVFTPPPPSDLDYAGLRAAVRAAREALTHVNRDEVNGFVGRDMRFEFRDRTIPFTAENFLLSFSLPNFYFHAATAYGILRMKGVPVGKRDFMGQLRIKQ